MKPKNKKKIWEKPEVYSLKIKRNTFGGIPGGAETGGGKTIPKKS
ncbi:MAG TPA: hypothetical protein VMV47_06115 [Bacteroidales bacterium]|nr:hypothetical protein [Bacteroidales bacterium]